MSLAYAGFVPHPPLLVPAVGEGYLSEVTVTREALQTLCWEVAARRPEVLILITPHGPILPGSLGIFAPPRLRGDFHRFRAPEVSVSVEVDQDLARRIHEQAAAARIPTTLITETSAAEWDISLTLDHALMVPLYYLQEAGIRAPVVALTMAFLPFETLYHYGQVLQQVAEADPRRVALIASGDLSHRLIPSAPAGYDPAGAEFDARVVDALRRLDAPAILNLNDELVERAGECGLRPLVMLLGGVASRGHAARILSYEGPFGVGYCVAAVDLHSARALPELAREAVERFVAHGDILPTPDPAEAPREWQTQAGVFVCLKKGGALRGCIGTIAPARPTLAEEVIHNAIHAATQDPRFPQVTAWELQELSYSVDILSEPEPVDSADDLDPRLYGVIVRHGRHSGLLLPDLQGVDTAEQQMHIALQKAGLRPGDPVDLFRFTVTRVEERVGNRR